MAFADAGIEIRPMIADNVQRQLFYSRCVRATYELRATDYVHEYGFYCGNHPELTRVDLETPISGLLA